jgi:hypothetical protein
MNQGWPFLVFLSASKTHQSKVKFRNKKLLIYRKVCSGADKRHQRAGLGSWVVIYPPLLLKTSFSVLTGLASCNTRVPTFSWVHDQVSPKGVPLLSIDFHDGNPADVAVLEQFNPIPKQVRTYTCFWKSSFAYHWNYFLLRKKWMNHFNTNTNSVEKLNRFRCYMPKYS